MIYHRWYENKKDAADALALRQEVFCDEQHFQDEFDEIDDRASHLVLYEETLPVACGRCFAEEDPACWHLGRLAVKKAFRGRGLGRLVLIVMEIKAVESGAKTTRLSAQMQAVPFYEKCGYHTVGESYLEENCPHILMEKDLAGLSQPAASKA